MSYKHRQPCERPQWLSQTSNELAKKCYDRTRSSVCKKKNWTMGQIHAMCIPCTHSTWQQRCFFRAFIEVWQNVFPEFIDSQLQTPAQLAHLMLIVRSMSDRIKALSFPVQVHKSANPWVESAFYSTNQRKG